MIGSGIAQKKPRRKRTIFAGTAGVVVVVLLCLAAIYQFAFPALIIGKTNVSRSKYKTLINQAKKEKVLEADAKKTIIEVEKKRQILQKYNVKVVDSEVVDAAVSRYTIIDTKNMNDWQKLNGYLAVFDSAIQLKKTGGFDGAIYEFPFSRNFDTFNINKVGPDFGNVNVIDADRKYAAEQAETYRKQLIDNRLTPERAVESLKANDRLVLGSAGNKSALLNLTETGSVFKNGDNFVVDKSSYLSNIKIDSLKNGEISPTQVKTMMLSYYKNPSSAKPQEVAFYFVQRFNKVEVNQNLEKNFANEYKDMKVKEYAQLF